MTKRTYFLLVGRIVTFRDESLVLCLDENKAVGNAGEDRTHAAFRRSARQFQRAGAPSDQLRDLQRWRRRRRGERRFGTAVRPPPWSGAAAPVPPSPGGNSKRTRI